MPKVSTILTNCLNLKGNSMPKISVIIPCYNVEKYLRECLDSVVNQTLTDIEIICINDGSTDSTLDILNEYKEKDSRIVIIDKHNEGVGVARNIGIKKATGKYLSILDSDDFFKRNMLELMYNKAEKNEADITICRSQCLNMQSNQIEAMFWSLQYLPDKETFSYKDLLPYHVFDFCIGWSWDKLYKREYVEKYKFKFYEYVRHSEDLFFVWHSIVCADKIAICPKILVTHRTNTSTQVSETRDDDPLCFIKITSDLKKILEKMDIYDSIEQSFVHCLVNFSFWHLETSSVNNKVILIEKLNSWFEELNVYKKPMGYFEDTNTPLKLQCIRNCDINSYNLLNFCINTHSEIRETFNIINNQMKNKNTFIENIFSIKNSKDKKHKIITVLGVPFSIRRHIHE